MNQFKFVDTSYDCFATARQDMQIMLINAFKYDCHAIEDKIPIVEC